MCRSIKQLRRPPAEPPTTEEINAAALQFIRKVSGFRVPSRANQPAFDLAVAEVAKATQVLLAALPAAKAPVAHTHPHGHAHDHAHDHEHSHEAGHDHPDKAGAGEHGHTHTREAAPA